MKNISREKIALLIFALLIVFGLGALVFYITGVGHSLNSTVSKIDDATGDLGDYTVIIYEGTADKKKAVVESEADRVTSAGSSKSSTLAQDQQIASKNKNSEVTASDIASKANPESAQSEALLTVGQVRNSFLRKHAAVYEVDLANPSVYNENVVVKAGKYRIGFISADAATLPHYLKSRIKDYHAAGVDLIVAVVDDLDRVSTVEGIDIVISTAEEGLNPNGVFSEGVFFNDAALKGEVGTILISPSKVISAKDIAEL